MTLSKDELKNILQFIDVTIENKVESIVKEAVERKVKETFKESLKIEFKSLLKEITLKKENFTTASLATNPGGVLAVHDKMPIQQSKIKKSPKKEIEKNKKRSNIRQRISQIEREKLEDESVASVNNMLTENVSNANYDNLNPPEFNIKDVIPSKEEIMEREQESEAEKEKFANVGISKALKEADKMAALL